MLIGKQAVVSAMGMIVTMQPLIVSARQSAFCIRAPEDGLQQKGVLDELAIGFQADSRGLEILGGAAAARSTAAVSAWAAWINSPNSG